MSENKSFRVFWEVKTSLDGIRTVTGSFTSETTANRWASLMGGCGYKVLITEIKVSQR